MSQDEFYDRIFYIQDATDKINKIIDSIRTMPQEKIFDAHTSVTNFVAEWLDREMDRNKGHFWEIRKKVLRDELNKQHQIIAAKLLSILTNTICNHG